MTKKPKVSVIIPCYNEEAVLTSCLEALKKQTAKPFEVIVVDNNSTDNTARIARSYGVKVIRESRQGLIPARDKGFKVAKGEIISKLDADSRPAYDWIEKISTLFKEPKIQAATGSGFFYDMPAKHLVKFYRNLFAVWLNRLALGHHMLWGSNLAIRQTAWLKISQDCCRLPDIMEDLDIAAHINNHFGGRSLIYSSKMKVDISGRRAMVSLKNNWLYLKMWPRTLALHGYQRRFILWPAVAILLTTMTMGRFYGRFYDAEKDRMIFTLQQWRNAPLYTRGNP